MKNKKTNIKAMENTEILEHTTITRKIDTVQNKSIMKKCRTKQIPINKKQEKL